MRHLRQNLKLWTLALALLLPMPAHAEWKNVQQVVLGTAQVLEKGAGNFGIFAPLAYGVTNRLTLETHPVYDLLLTVNAHVRYRVLDSQRFVLSAIFDVRQSFYNGTHPGDLSGGAMATVYLNETWALTGSLRYSAIVNPARCQHLGYAEPTCVDPVDGQVPTLDNGTVPSLAVHWLATPRDLLELSATIRLRLAPFLRETPTVTAVWVHDFGRWHLMAGATAGEFFIGRLDALTGVVPPGENPTYYVLPVMPVLDAWFRF